MQDLTRTYTASTSTAAGVEVRLPDLPAAEARDFSVDQRLLSALLHGPGDFSGVGVTPDKALTFSAVFAAINAISTDLASLPLKVFRQRPDGGREAVPDHPVSTLLGETFDGEAPAMRSRQALIGHVLGHGNAYAEIRFRRSGFPAALHLLDPTTTRPERTDATGALRYAIDGGRKRLPPSRVLHIAGLGGDGLVGYSPIQQARQTIGLGMALEQVGAAFFGNGAFPGGIIEPPAQLDEETTKNFMAVLHQRQGGTSKAGRWFGVPPGTKVTPLPIDLDDAAWLASRQFQINEIARIFRISPVLLQEMTDAHLRNFETSLTSYSRHTLTPWACALEAEINRKLLTPDERRDGMFVEHSMQGLLRGDSKARTDAYTALFKLGAITPAQVARFENLEPPGEGGDLHFVQSALAPLTSIEDFWRNRATAAAPDPEPAQEGEPIPDENPES